MWFRKKKEPEEPDELQIRCEKLFEMTKKTFEQEAYDPFTEIESVQEALDYSNVLQCAYATIKEENEPTAYLDIEEEIPEIIENWPVSKDGISVLKNKYLVETCVNDIVQCAFMSAEIEKGGLKSIREMADEQTTSRLLGRFADAARWIRGTVYDSCKEPFDALSAWEQDTLIEAQKEAQNLLDTFLQHRYR